MGSVQDLALNKTVFRADRWFVYPPQNLLPNITWNFLPQVHLPINLEGMIWVQTESVNIWIKGWDLSLQISPFTEGRGSKNISKPESLGREGKYEQSCEFEDIWRTILWEVKTWKDTEIASTYKPFTVFIPNLAQAEKVLSSKDGGKRDLLPVVP